MGIFPQVDLKLHDKVTKDLVKLSAILNKAELFELSVVLGDMTHRELTDLRLKIDSIQQVITRTSYLYD